MRSNEKKIIERGVVHRARNEPKTLIFCFELIAYFDTVFFAADPNAWRLGRIDEADHETAV